jgi:Putative prokaryotic signal transducing protein
MRELLRTNDIVRLTWLTVLLSDEGIPATVLDTHTSILEGSIGAIPRRLMVEEQDFIRARAILETAGESLPEEPPGKSRRERL